MPSEPLLSTVMNDVLATLSSYLNPVTVSLPSSTVTLVSASKKNPAIGSRIGTSHRSGYPTTALKGGHLRATVQFQIWDTSPEDIEVEMNALHGRLLEDRDNLRVQGFIALKADKTSISERISDLNAWRKTTLFNLLYEYQYQDNDGAESIITRIPIASSLDGLNSTSQEDSTVIDSIQRWDDESATALTLLANSGSNKKVFGFNLLGYLPGGWAGDPVVIDRTNLGTITPPTIYPTLNDFIDAVTDSPSPDTNARVVFASVASFIAALNPDGAPFELGDWDQDLTPDQYQAYQKIFTQPLLLTQANDLFRISYQTPPFNAKSVVYLRAKVVRKVIH